MGLISLMLAYMFSKLTFENQMGVNWVLSNLPSLLTLNRLIIHLEVFYNFLLGWKVLLWLTISMEEKKLIKENEKKCNYY